MRESYDISVLFKMFKRFENLCCLRFLRDFLKSGPSFDLRRKIVVNEGNLAVPESPYTHYWSASLFSNSSFK